MIFFHEFTNGTPSWFLLINHFLKILTTWFSFNWLDNLYTNIYIFGILKHPEIALIQYIIQIGAYLRKVVFLHYLPQLLLRKKELRIGLRIFGVCVCKFYFSIFV
jgi:hypothetical protein